jgi:methionyl-tRNA synthetase
MPTYTETISNVLINHGFAPASAGAIAGGFLVLIAVLAVWSLIWKGFALWYAARNHQKIWFIAFLVINTAGILEILYLIFWRKNKNDVVHTTTVTHTVTASTPAPDMASSETSMPSVPPAAV